VQSSNERNTEITWRNELEGTVGGSSFQAGSIKGDVHFNMDSRPSQPAPAQLPSLGLFADRRSELADLRRLSQQAADAGHPGLVVITGPGGVGKTSLALHWLHQVKADYEGQLFVDMRGFSGGEPLPPAEPLERFLRALGVAAGTIPGDVDEQAALFRSMTTGRRLIIMLDNVASAAQVRPLLPGTGAALIVVTTRQRLSGLLVDGARYLDLNPLGVPGALELLGHLIGSGRIADEGEDARALVTLCGLLPLAVCASGARLAARRRWPIARVVAELGNEARRLSSLHAGEGEMSVSAVFNTSYQALDQHRARAYRLLGTHPGTDFGIEAVAALLGIDSGRAGELLNSLADASLLVEGPIDRYRFHDLVRLHADAKARELDSEADRTAALARLADWYLRTASAADLVLLPGRWRLGAYYTPERQRDVAGQAIFSDRSDALAWFEQERLNIVAVARQAHASGLHAITWQLCEAMWSLFLLRKYYATWIHVHELGLAAAEACADLPAQARMLSGLGMAYLNLQDFSTAQDRYQTALDLERQARHHLGEAAALEGLGIAELATGNAPRAIELFSRARDLHAGLGRPRGVALMSRHLGEALGATGRHLEAIEVFTEVLEFFTRTEEPYHRARTLTCLGRAQLRADRLDDATATLREALDVTREAGARHEEANVLRELAGVAARQGDPAAEQRYLEQALAIYAELDAPQADVLRTRLSGPPKSPPGSPSGPPS
jgi:tetratricopeptide (TPR) repeat protein